MEASLQLPSVKLYSYIVTHDTGFAPNPFWGCCTLANCKPRIRRTASEGDWIVGLSRKASENRLIYAMKVDEITDFATYYNDPRFAAKQPDFTKGTVVYKCGDNIYAPMSGGRFRQLQSSHSNGENENPKTKAHDLEGRNVLIGHRYVYFGMDGPELPTALEALKVGRAHKCRFPPEVIESFLTFIEQFDNGVVGRPARWPEHDQSWRQDES